MHWRNSSFQIRYFIVGACHTPDEAYRKLLELAEERLTALNHAMVESKRALAKALRARAWWRNLTAAQRLDNQAALDELRLGRPVVDDCIQVAREELAHIRALLEQLEPHRKYRSLPNHEAHQACQREEWLEELKARAREYLATVGAIPADQLRTMTLHPNFDDTIAPYIKSIAGRADAAVLCAPSPIASLLDADGSH